MQIQPTNLSTDSADVKSKRNHDSAPTTEQVNSFVNNRLDAADTNGQPNNFQIADKLNISPQAKQALEDAMARQQITFAENSHGPISKEQLHFVYNGSVHKALESYANGQGSLANVVTALQGRGERMHDVVSSENDAQAFTPATDNSQSTNASGQ